VFKLVCANGEILTIGVYVDNLQVAPRLYESISYIHG
jgi:hypothetical protein